MLIQYVQAVLSTYISDSQDKDGKGILGIQYVHIIVFITVSIPNAMVQMSVSQDFVRSRIVANQGIHGSLIRWLNNSLSARNDINSKI